MKFILNNLTCANDVVQAVNEIGFLPLFSSVIEGFSVEDNIDKSKYYFVDGIEGMWKWKEQIASQGIIPYGKYFNKSAGFVSRKWFPYLCNFRRDGYDIDSRIDEGSIKFDEKIIYNLLYANGPMLSVDLKRASGIKSFDTLITKMQQETYVSVKKFIYKIDKNGKRYGWGIAEYDLTDNIFSDISRTMYSESPKTCYEKMFEHLHNLMPFAPDKSINKILL